jgi:hypothetical protein
MSTEAVGDVSKDPDPILELYPEHSIGKDLEDPTCSQIGWLGHERLLYPNRIGFNPCRARSAQPRPEVTRRVSVCGHWRPRTG